MIKKVSILLAGFLSAAFILPYIVMAAGGAFIVDQGGTGWQAFTANSILLGNGKNRLATTSAGTNGQILELVNQVPTFVTASSSNGTVTNIATTFPIQGGPITSTGTLTFGGLSTTSPWTQGQLAAVFGSNGNQVSSVSTTTLAGGGPITVSNSPVLIGSSGAVLGCTSASNGVAGCMTAQDWGLLHTATSTFASPLSYSVSTNQVTCSTCNTSSASVTSIVGGTGLNGGTITTSGTLSLKSYFGTTTADTIGQVLLWTSTNGTPANVGSNSNFSFATAGQTLLTVTNASTTAISVNGNEMSGQRYLSFTISTSTNWTGTSTIGSPFGDAGTVYAPFKGTSATLQCGTNVGTQTVEISDGSTHTYLPGASSTANTNNFVFSFSKGDALTIQAGNVTASPTTTACTMMSTGF